MRAALVVAVLLTIPRGADAQQWSWKEHVYPEEGFRVEFNGPVVVRPIPLNAETQQRVARGRQYMQSAETHVYIAAASLNKLDVNLDSGAETSFRALRCKSNVKDSRFDSPWGPGREIRGEECIDGSYRVAARYHQSGLWFYQVMALFKTAGGDEASARYFVQSFRVTRQH